MIAIIALATNASSLLPFTDYLTFLIVMYALAAIFIFAGGVLRIIGFIVLGIAVLASVYIAFIFITLSQLRIPSNSTTAFIRSVIGILIPK